MPPFVKFIMKRFFNATFAKISASNKGYPPRHDQLDANRRVTSRNAILLEKEVTIPITFDQMVAKARAEVPGIKPEEAHKMIQADSNTLIVDVRDPADIAITGLIPGTINITLGTLTYKADHQVPPGWRDPSFNDFSRPIITTCETGEMAALAGKLLKDMGYTHVHILEGGTVAWKEAGYEVRL